MRSHCTISCHLHEISRLISAAQCDLCMKSHARRHGFSRYTCYMHMHMLASDISCPEAHTHSGTAHPRPRALSSRGSLARPAGARSCNRRAPAARGGCTGVRSLESNQRNNSHRVTNTPPSFHIAPSPRMKLAELAQARGRGRSSAPLTTPPTACIPWQSGAISLHSTQAPPGERTADGISTHLERSRQHLHDETAFGRILPISSTPLRSDLQLSPAPPGVAELS